MGFLVLAKDYSPRAQFMPVVISAISILVMLVEFYVVNFTKGLDTGIDTAELFGADRKEEEFRQSSATAEDCPVDVLAPAGGDERVMFLWIGLLTVMILLLGFNITEFVFPLIYLRFASKLSWRTSILVSFATWLVIFLLFGTVLQLPFFPGFLFGGEF